MSRRQAPSPNALLSHWRRARETDQLGQAIGFPRSISPVRLQRLAARLHALGPRATYEFLRELPTSPRLLNRLEAYARLDPDTVWALGGDVLPTDWLLVIDGDG